MTFLFTAEEGFRRLTNWTEMRRKHAFGVLKDKANVAGKMGYYLYPESPVNNRSIILPEYQPRDEFTALLDSDREHLYFDLLKYFYESTDGVERSFAIWAVRRMPSAIKLCFEEVQRLFNFWHNPLPGYHPTDRDTALRCECFLHYLKLLLKLDQFQLLHYVAGHMAASVKCFKDAPARLLAPRGLPASGYAPDLYASIFDKASIRPLLGLLNNFDLLPNTVVKTLSPCLFDILKKRAAPEPSLLEKNEERSFLYHFVDREELNDRRGMLSLLWYRRSLLESVLGGEQLDELFAILEEPD